MGSTPKANSLDEIPRDAPLVPLVEIRRPHVRMPEERLNLIRRNALLVQVRGNGDPKRVRRNAGADAGTLGVTPHHLVNIIASHRGFCELAGPPCSGAKEIEGLPFAGLRIPLRGSDSNGEKTVHPEEARAGLE